MTTISEANLATLRGACIMNVYVDHSVIFAVALSCVGRVDCRTFVVLQWRRL